MPTAIPDLSKAVRFHGVTEPGHAIRVEIYHDAVNDATLRLASAPIPFLMGDTIRLYLSRKYAAEGIKGMLDFCALEVVAEASSRTVNGFGNQLMLLAPADASQHGTAGSHPLHP